MKRETGMKHRIVAMTMAVALAVSCITAPATTADAATKVKVSSVKAVDSLTGSKTITLTVGKKATIKTTVKVKPNKSKYKKVTYKSSNKKVATVSSKGVITAKKVGKCTITVKSTKNKKKYAKLTVKVVKGKVTKVSLKGTKKTLKVGAKYTLKATVKATKGANKKLDWSSSKSSVATVSSKGVVTAKKAGTATITVMSTDGTKKKDTFKITVKDWKTTVAPKDGASVEAEVAFNEGVTAEQLQADVDKVATFVNDTTFVINLDGKDYTATIGSDKKVRINGKLLTESAKAKAAKKVIIKTTIKADKVVAVVAFTPASVASVKIADVTFTDITVDSFKIGTKKYKYEVDGKTIVIVGDATKTLKSLESVADITKK